jgi:hypothetical protein
MHGRALALLVGVERFQLGNQIYYFEVARGAWSGEFRFLIRDKRAFREASLPVYDRILAWLLNASQRVLGPSQIVSRIHSFPGEGIAGVNRSKVWIRKLLVTVYAMQGEYVLDADGVGVRVTIHERFGPIPFLFRHVKQATARIDASGMDARYRMPLLGAEWDGHYTVADDRDHVVAVYTCSWGEAQETIARVKSVAG